jgi:hypothetical protein
MNFTRWQGENSRLTWKEFIFNRVHVFTWHFALSQQKHNKNYKKHQGNILIVNIVNSIFSRDNNFFMCLCCSLLSSKISSYIRRKTFFHCQIIAIATSEVAKSRRFLSWKWSSSDNLFTFHRSTAVLFIVSLPSFMSIPSSKYYSELIRK